MPGGPAIGFEALSLPRSEMSVSRAGDGAITFEAKPHLGCRKASLTSGELRVAARDIAIDLSRMKLARKRGALLSLAGASRERARRCSTGLPAGRKQAGRLGIDSGQMTFEDTSAGRRIAGGLAYS